MKKNKKNVFYPPFLKKKKKKTVKKSIFYNLKTLLQFKLYSIMELKEVEFTYTVGIMNLTDRN